LNLFSPDVEKWALRGVCVDDLGTLKPNSDIPAKYKRERAYGNAVTVECQSRHMLLVIFNQRPEM
jgi:hypothetical protein